MHLKAARKHETKLIICLVALAALLALLGGCRRTEPLPPAAEFAYAPTEVRATEEVGFDASGSHAPAGQIVSYAWDFGDGTTAEGVSPVHTYAEEGTYTVTLTVTDEVGGVDEAQAELEVLPAAEPPPDEYTLTVNTEGSGMVTREPHQASYADGTEVELTATADSGWSFSGWSGDLSGDDNPATITMDEDKEVTATFIELDPGDPPEAAFEFEPEVGEPPLTVTFDASDSTGAIVAYEWDFGDGTTGTGVTTEHTYTEVGQYEVRLTVRDGEGREDTAVAEGEDRVHVIPPPPPPPGGRGS